MAVPTVFAGVHADSFAYATKLTTAFQPEASCFPWVKQDSTQFRFPGGELPTCFPDKMTFVSPHKTAAYYSPARCPASYTPYRVTAGLNGVRTAPVTYNKEDKGDYVYFCCPKSLLPDDSIDQGCVSYVTEPMQVTYLDYDNTVGLHTELSTMSLETGFPIELVGYGLQVRFQNSDLDALKFSQQEMELYGLNENNEDSSGPTLDVETAGATATNDAEKGFVTSVVYITSDGVVMTSDVIVEATTAPDQDGSGASRGSSGLSTTAKIAIGIAVPTVFLIIALIIAIVCLMKRSRRHKNAQFNEQNAPPYIPPPADVAVAGGYYRGQQHTMSDKYVPTASSRPIVQPQRPQPEATELPGTPYGAGIHELPQRSATVRHELPGREY